MFDIFFNLTPPTLRLWLLIHFGSLAALSEIKWSKAELNKSDNEPDNGLKTDTENQFGPESLLLKEKQGFSRQNGSSKKFGLEHAMGNLRRRKVYGKVQFQPA